MLHNGQTYPNWGQYGECGTNSVSEVKETISRLSHYRKFFDFGIRE